MTHQQLATAVALPPSETLIGPVIALLPPPRNALLESARQSARLAAANDDLPAAANDDGADALPAAAAAPAAAASPAAAPAEDDALPPLGTQRARLSPRAATPAIRRRRKLQVTALSTATAISFSLTFMVAGLALLLGLVPTPDFAFTPELDIGVLMLFVPVCALTLAVLFEVTRVIVRGVPEPALRPASVLRWQPRNGEG